MSHCLDLHVLLNFLLSCGNHTHGIMDLLQFIITALLFSQVGILIQLPRHEPLIQFPLELPHRLKFILQLYLLLRLWLNNLNQITRRFNSTGRLYTEELSETKQELERAESMLRKIYEQLSEINI